jgi:UDP-N-acetylglucosamine 2-epimerase (non-hydrolysing)
MNPLRAMIVIGSRTEAIRLAPLVQECRRRDTIEPTVCLAGQRRDSIGQVIDYFGVEADVDLPVGPPHLSVAEATARCLTGIDQALARYRPDCLIAHGQAGIGAAAALAAVYRGIPFVNVAGYRQRENAADTMHRRLLTHAATLHCAPTARERDELLAEGLAPADVLATGDHQSPAAPAVLRLRPGPLRSSGALARQSDPDLGSAPGSRASRRATDPAGRRNLPRAPECAG